MASPEADASFYRDYHFNPHAHARLWSKLSATDVARLVVREQVHVACPLSTHLWNEAEKEFREVMLLRQLAVQAIWHEHRTGNAHFMSRRSRTKPAPFIAGEPISFSGASEPRL